MNLLKSIEAPYDLKKIAIEDLPMLCEEIRQRIMDVMSVNGGHLASNLGMIEITVALHYVFDSPVDKFIFDTSHQSYTHKILTGRNKSFASIRQYKGLCGFCDPNESAHDHFYAGHAATALSLATGVAQSRNLTQEDYHVVPILGDAALTCGLTFEALNNIPKNLSKFLVILNDNAMSISKNVGAITKILSKMFNSPTANRLYEDVEVALKKIPAYGSALADGGHRVRESIKQLFSTAPFFEQYNLNYTGPIDGHNVRLLIETFQKLKDNHSPIIIHALTTKGKGMDPAMENPTPYHGAKPFDRATGKFIPQPISKPTFPKIFGSQILEQAKNNPHLAAITPAMPAGSCLEALMQEFPDRCFDVGIAEGHSVTFAAGLAKNKKIHVICCIYSTFAQRAFDNIFHDVCLQNIPVTFAFDRAGIAGADGATHNGIYDLGFLKQMPNLIIAQPRNGRVLRELLQSSQHWDQPSLIRYPNLPTDDEKPKVERLIPGEAELLQRGSDVLLIALGHKVETAREVAKSLLKEYHIKATIVDPIFISPLDESLIHSLLSSHALVVTIEEHAQDGGLGSIVNDFMIKLGPLPNKVINFGIPSVFIEHGKHKDLTEEAGLSANQILQQIKEHLPEASYLESKI